MKRAYLFSSIGLVGLVGATGAVIQTAEKTLRERASVGTVAVGGLKPDAAQLKLRQWWENERLKPITLKLNGKKVVAEMTPGALGVSLDDIASINQVPESSTLVQAVSKDESESTYPVKFKQSTVDLVPLKKKVAAMLPEPTPAKVKFSGGAIVRVKEGARQELNTAGIPELVLKAVQEGKSEIDLPLDSAPKKISDEMLAGIKDVIGEFSTRFSAGNAPRSSNIRLAASKLDGVILLPGETVSFNGTVGRRTLKGGFRMAGVYVNGRHDTGVGGGICQVSTTLYNAALFSDLGIVTRSNHSLPVPYVPLGRDATVDYGNIDLVLRNTTQDPIVLASHYVPGKLTFRILGTKREPFKVRMVSTGVSRREGRARRVIDRSLPPGTTKVSGGSGILSLSTTRVVERNGQVRRDPPARSYYGGGVTTIAYNPAPRRPKSTPRTVAPTAPVQSPVVEAAPSPSSTSQTESESLGRRSR